MPRHVKKGEWVRTTVSIRNKLADLMMGDEDPVLISLPAGARLRVGRDEVQGCVRVEVTTPSGQPALLLLEDGEWEESWDDLGVGPPLGG